MRVPRITLSSVIPIGALCSSLLALTPCLALSFWTLSHSHPLILGLVSHGRTQCSTLVISHSASRAHTPTLHPLTIHTLTLTSSLDTHTLTLTSNTHTLTPPLSHSHPGGLIVAVVITYAGNILKNFGSAIALLVTSWISMLLFSTRQNMMFWYGAVAVCVVQQFNNVKNHLLEWLCGSAPSKQVLCGAGRAWVGL